MIFITLAKVLASAWLLASLTAGAPVTKVEQPTGVPRASGGPAVQLPQITDKATATSSDSAGPTSTTKPTAAAEAVQSRSCQSWTARMETSDGLRISTPVCVEDEENTAPRDMTASKSITNPKESTMVLPVDQKATLKSLVAQEVKRILDAIEVAKAEAEAKAKAKAEAEAETKAKAEAEDKALAKALGLRAFV